MLGDGAEGSRTRAALRNILIAVLRAVEPRRTVGIITVIIWLRVESKLKGA